MEFRIYLRRFGKLIKLYKFDRTKAGLYIISSPSTGDDYDTYHEDGNYWHRYRGRKMIKKRRQPLSSFAGTETLFSAAFSVMAPTSDALEANDVNLKEEDIIIEREGAFGLEVIMAEKKIQLIDLPDRPNNTVYFKELFQPIIIVEVYNMADNVIRTPRFSPDRNWVDGQDFFYDHDGRI